MKISIITATFNSAKTIESAIQSVLDQTYHNLEHIIVDGGSTDNTLQIVKTYQKNQPTILYTSEPDQGIYDALNKGIAMANGEVVGLLHSDDLLYARETIQHIANIFKNEAVNGVYGDLQYVSKDDTNQVIRYWKSEAFEPNLLKRGWMPAHPSLFLKKEVFQNYGNFDLSFKIAADYDFILRIFKQSDLKFRYLNEVITKMRVGGASNRSLKNIILKSQEDLRALKKNGMANPYIILSQKNLSKIPQFFKK